MKTLLFSYEGRIARGPFWKWNILISLAGIAAMVVLSLIIGQFIGNQSNEAGEYKVEGAAALPFTLASLAVFVPMMWASFCLGIKRYHDRGKSGAWVLIMFVPFIGGIWYFVEAGCLRGTVGPNAFGPDPLGGVPVGAGLAPA